MNGEPYVYHFVVTHDGRDVERRDPIGTLVMNPAERFKLGPDQVEQAVESERRRWQRAVLQQYGPGWAVRVVRERGFVRSIYPGAALPSDAPTGVIAVPAAATGQRSQA